MQEQDMVPEQARAAMETLKDKGQRVELVGTFENGKLQFDAKSFEKLGQSSGKFAFVAVNAPFAG